MIRLRLVAVTVFATSLPALVLSDTVTDWNDTAIRSIAKARLTSPPAARVLAMVHGAIFDAVNAIEGAYRPYAFEMSPDPGASSEAAAAAAAFGVLVRLFPSQEPELLPVLQASLDLVPDGPPEDSGRALGDAVAALMVEWRQGDGAGTMVPYTPGTEIGEWRPTPPAFAPAMLPGWGSVTPFIVDDLERFHHPGPPNIRGIIYALNVMWVERIGAKDSAVRTAEQTAIARFWVDMPGTPTTIGRWNGVARQLTAARGSTLGENARLFALLNLALADTGIAVFGCKYANELWRPVTAIREAAADGNRWTSADPVWEPLVMTPAFPEYPSAHSAFSAAAATVLARFSGRDRFEFAIPDFMDPTIVRRYSSLRGAASEAGMSRIYAGIHFMFGNTRGLEIGWRIGDLAWKGGLLPVRKPR